MSLKLLCLVGLGLRTSPDLIRFSLSLSLSLLCPHNAFCSLPPPQCSKDVVILDKTDGSRKFTEADWYRWDLRIYRKYDGGWKYSKDDFDYDDIQFKLLHGSVEGLVVPTEAVQGCWGAGSEIAITSHTLRFEDSQTATIKNVTAGPIPGTSKLIIDGGIVPATTMQEAERNLDGTTFAAEIALLSRNVEIHSDNQDDSRPSEVPAARQGGYVQVTHTPTVQQKINGVEFRYMGQDKNADRFVSCLVGHGFYCLRFFVFRF